MKNYKIINKNNLINNINYCKNKCNIMAMIKANAYGHGYKQVVKILNNYVNWYGVANEKEAISVRKISDKNILVVGKTSNYEKLIINNISIAIESIEELKQVNCLAKKLKRIANVHIKVNSGMNRLGVKSFRLFKLIVNLIDCCEYLNLEGVFTHFYDADKFNNHFKEQIDTFAKYVSLVDKKDILIHIGGSYVLNYKLPKFVNLVRVGYFMYGYGRKELKPVMSIESEIIKINKCSTGEMIGYGHTKLKEDKTIGIVPLGYADGYFITLSNKSTVRINNKEFNVIGKVCMDMLFVDITNSIVKVGDKVEVLYDAESLAKICKTSPYEILTNFNKLRGKNKIVK